MATIPDGNTPARDVTVPAYTESADIQKALKDFAAKWPGYFPTTKGASPVEGDTYLDSATGKAYAYLGGAWAEIGGGGDAGGGNASGTKAQLATQPDTVHLFYATDERKFYGRISVGVGAAHFVPFESGLEGLGGWADVTATTGTPTKHEYTDASGFDWTAYEFKANGSITTTEGLVDVLIVAQGGGGDPDGRYGTGGQVIPSVTKLPAGTAAVTVGTTGNHQRGAPSSLGTLLAGGGVISYVPGSAPAGVHSSITGSDIAYGADSTATSPTSHPGLGHGGKGGTSALGATGTVIIRVPKSNAKA